MRPILLHNPALGLTRRPLLSVIIRVAPLRGQIHQVMGDIRLPH